MIVGSGLSAWSLLNSTLAAQKETFSKSAEIQRDVNRFQSAAPSVSRASDLVQDRTLLKVSLGAFDLLGDLQNRYFIQRVIEEGTSSSSSLANKLQDTRYKGLASTFSFDRPKEAEWRDPERISKIADRYIDLSFERAVGEQSEGLRLAMSVQRELPEIASSTQSNNAAWYKVLGTRSLRNVFETVFGLPTAFSQIDLDKQLEIMKEKSVGRFGTDVVSELASEEVVSRVTQVFLLQSQIQEVSTSSSKSIALQLLGNLAKNS